MNKIVDGKLVKLSPNEESEIKAQWAANRAKPIDVAAEAERRISAGILVDGHAFRADDASRQRLAEMIGQFGTARMPPSGQTFRTAAGAEFTWTRVEQPQAVADVVAGYVMAVLAKSAELQRAPPLDYAADRHWPAVPQTLVNRA